MISGRIIVLGKNLEHRI